MKAVATLRRMVRNSDSTTQLMAEIREGVANQSNLLNNKLESIRDGVANESILLSD